VLLWADIENEPQVQYLLPIVEACHERGADILVTARDYGATFELLESRGVSFSAVGTSYGASKSAKIAGLVRRSRDLAALLRRTAVPDSLVCASRAGAIVARRFGIPSYVISDYEYANLTLFRWARSTILHPDVIASQTYREAGFPANRLIPFRGLKEDITFADVDLDGVEPPPLGEPSGTLARVLVRPPAVDSHYYSRRSGHIYLEALEFVARDEHAVLVLAPRYPRQIADLDALAFANEPIVLEHPVPFLALLKAVDLILCSGGTMLREAAYLGIPAYSIFGSRVGAVDHYLESIGRATLLSSREDLTRIRIEKTPSLNPLRQNPALVDEVAAIVLRTPPG
jgi:predicted glycosyltransferase